MTRRRKHTTWTAALLAAALWGCTDTPVTPPNPAAPATGAGELVVGRGGFQVQEAKMRALLRQVTREVAVALADEALRAQVYADLHASPFREHKLHLGTLLRADGRSLLSAMAAARVAAAGAAPAPGVAVASEAVLATLDSIVDLEFYMPVKAHFAAWDGGARLVVASSLRDDGRVPDGFDLAGQAVALSAAEPPATPTLVLVPVETDFSTTRPVAVAGVDAGPADIAGVHMTRSVIYSDHEGWPNGNPEFEVHLFQTSPNSQYIDAFCVGQLREAPYTYNTQETQDWSGDVLLVPEERLIDLPNNQFQVWEDDGFGGTYDPCTQFSGRPPRADGDTYNEYKNWTSAYMNVSPAGTVVGILKQLYNLVPAFYALFLDDGDDPVGALVLPDNCWPTASGPVNFRIRASSPGHPETGWATLDFRVSGTREPICLPPVNIYGEDPVPPNGVCAYQAAVTSGTPPFTYAWKADGVPVGDGSEWYWHPVGESGFTLEVEVTDAGGRPGKGTRMISIDSTAPQCLQ